MSFKLPKKRYLLAAVAVAYLIAKLYVLQTATPCDDNLPDRVRDIVMQVLASHGNDLSGNQDDSPQPL